MRWWLGTALGTAAVLACNSSAFTCADDSECSGGVCQPTGACSFPDDSCPSGQRYGEHAAGDLAGTCVEVEQTEGTMSSTSSTSSPSTAGASTLMLDDDSSGPLTSTTEGGTTTSESSSTGEPVDPDLLLWFRFEDLSERGTIDSAHGFQATCEDTECPVAAMSLFGQGALFDGQDDGLSVPFDPLFEVSEAFTIAAWIRVDGVPGPDIRMIFGHPFGPDTSNAWLLSVRPLFMGWGGGMTMSSDGELHVVVTPMASSLGAWTHVAGTYDGSEMTLFVNGQPVASGVAPPPVFDAGHPITIGRDINANQPAGFFHGVIDEVRLYSRALDQEELAALAAG
ncbi:LamG domain-containing protein [Paraliomyxa miuraensis]|uniref:LamG domain-containing protein n=1 Tax=Paraliomyxa miuraensis TaxID=376150 RepID=UPI002256F7BB|nr:LamG domain-containing protein [Paraliomyxa miuraensis]MCX4241912.1 LamG domain-containing protein [Paraliomyxa miuraensis]